MATQATLNGILADDGGEACDCGFQWGTSPAFGTTTGTQSRRTGEAFSQVIYFPANTEFSPTTTYHFRSFATNSVGTRYGATLTFVTTYTPGSGGCVGVGSSIAHVTTMQATGVAESLAYINGYVDDDAGYNGEVSFEWGASMLFGEETPWIGNHDTGDSFQSKISPLGPGVSYFYRARFRNRYGIFYGGSVSFTTLSYEGQGVLVSDGSLLLIMEG